MTEQQTWRSIAHFCRERSVLVQDVKIIDGEIVHWIMSDGSVLEGGRIISTKSPATSDQRRYETEGR